MAKIEYVANLNQLYQGQGFPLYQWSKFETSPWTPFAKPLGEACIALLSSAGIFSDDQQPFDPWAVNDLSFRKIPRDTPYKRLRLHHNYFDHRDAGQDLNCVFPLQRLSELEAEGFIGRFAPTAVTLGMGRMYKRTALLELTVPKIVDVFRAQETDAVLLVAA
jgi:D-proline reductase (dithiol) PrdB